MASFCKFLVLILLSLLTLLGVLLFRAEVYFPYPKHVPTCNETHDPISGQDIVDRFRKALQIKTLTFDRLDYDRDALTKFASFLRASKIFQMI